MDRSEGRRAVATLAEDQRLTPSGLMGKDFPDDDVMVTAVVYPEAAAIEAGQHAG